ncbi:MAG: YmdB family metallophosphoesterase, partial [Victivallales bacterium]|nr:YmdB family metallophosphoesterase [Victivallales bacterium]
KREFNCSFCVANGENSAGGGGINAKCANHIHPDFVDVITTGDHVWDQKEFALEIESLGNRVLRPANLSDSQPGKGAGVYRNPGGGEIAVINLIGKIFMRESAYCPFEKVETVLKTIPPTVVCRIVDFHTEATSEAAAMARFLDGRVTAVIGTHTLVQTADAKILPKGTAFITDVGMVGSENSILGREIDAVLSKFVSGMPQRLPVNEKEIRLDAVVVSYDLNTGEASAITPISRRASF